MLDALDALVHATLLIERDSEEARREEEYLSAWNWGVPAAMLHFCLQDADFLPLEAAEQLQEAKSAEVRSPGLHLPNEGRFHPVISLKDDVQKNSALTAVMERRRTVRECDATAYVGQGSIADCLYAGLGITGWTSNCVGKLPLGMTPSGGRGWAIRPGRRISRCMTARPTASAPAVPAPASARRILAASFVGTAIEFYDLYDVDGHYQLVMEFVDGQSLDRVMAAHRYPNAEHWRMLRAGTVDDGIFGGAQSAPVRPFLQRGLGVLRRALPRNRP